MISISGTIGMGLFISAGQIIRLSGSAGAFLSYFVTGLIAICVMDSISEMVALIPEAGALQEYPRRFVDPALGWAVAGTYWFSYAMGVPNLATSTAILATGFNSDVSVGWIITGILVVVILINILGIKVGNLIPMSWVPEYDRFCWWMLAGVLMGMVLLWCGCGMEGNCGRHCTILTVSLNYSSTARSNMSGGSSRSF
jgi:amino acid transporter